jgi:hypothetical protein
MHAYNGHVGRRQCGQQYCGEVQICGGMEREPISEREKPSQEAEGKSNLLETECNLIT